LLIENNKISVEFKQEMRRFLSNEQVNQIVDKDNLWVFINYLIDDLGNQLLKNANSD
jgi:hypothetical protein